MKKMGFLILISFLFTSCFYSYGIKFNDKNLKYKSEKRKGNNKYEMISTLYYDDLFSDPFIIEIIHLSKVPFYSGRYESVIRIEDHYPYYDKKINFKTIKVILSKKGEELQEERIVFRALKQPQDKSKDKIEITEIPDEYIINKGDLGVFIEYTKEYNMKMRPFGGIDEYIYIEYEVDGKPYVLEYNFPLKYKYGGSILNIIESNL